MGILQDKIGKVSLEFLSCHAQRKIDDVAIAGPDRIIRVKRILSFCFST